MFHALEARQQRLTVARNSSIYIYNAQPFKTAPRCGNTFPIYHQLLLKPLQVTEQTGTLIVPEKLTFPSELTTLCGVVPAMAYRWHHMVLLSLMIRQGPFLSLKNNIPF